MNRKQKRAQTNGTTQQQTSASTQSSPRVKPLYEIAAEKQAELLPHLKPTSSPNHDPSLPTNMVNVKIGPDGKIIKGPSLSPSLVSTLEGDGTEDEGRAATDISPILDTLLFAASLSAIHFTLDTLTVHQYAQSLEFLPIVRRTCLTAFPSFLFLVHFSRGHLFPPSVSSALPPRVKALIGALVQICYLVVANIAGCYLIRLTNDKGYYAVMKRAPGIGTLWVWAVLEMGLLGAVGGVLGPGIYAWWNGYGVV